MNTRSSLQRFISALLALYCACAGAAPADAEDPHWNCYDAQPSHPTAAEKTAFIAELAPAAQAAEMNGGPPAAALLAMSALESGFGWTRTALFAHNLFGWKYVSPDLAGQRKSWTLDCQPASDKNNRYIVFKDRGDSLAFVAERLTTASRYRAITRQYQDNRARGTSVNAAVAQWVRGIAAAGYNPLERYPATVLAVANDYQHPGSSESRTNSLFAYSARVADAAAPALTRDAASPGTASRDAAAQVLAATLARARYMSKRCDPEPVTDWPDYAGRRVVRCEYAVTSAGKTLKALVFLLNPSADNIAARIGNACGSVGLAGHAGCGRYLASFIVNQNGAQFPVAGFVIERKRDAGGKGDDPVYLEFRDGTTVQTKDGLNFTDRQLDIQAMEHAARAPVAKTRRVARIANATREDYRRGGGTMAVGATPDDDKLNQWPAAVRANELDAQDTGQDLLLRGLARGLRSTLAHAK